MIYVDSPAPGWAPHSPTNLVAASWAITCCCCHCNTGFWPSWKSKSVSRGAVEVKAFGVGILEFRTLKCSRGMSGRDAGLERWRGWRPCPWVTGGCECEREGSGTGGEHGCGRGGCDRTPVLLYSGRPRMERKGSRGS